MASSGQSSVPQSDYAEVEDFKAGLQGFKARLANYEKVYEPVEEGSYVKVIDMASGQSGQIQVSVSCAFLRRGVAASLLEVVAVIGELEEIGGAGLKQWCLVVPDRW
ncbi:hypothetical protein IFM89_034199 [Coptis chinensis]|uniref:Uncharacterized protein n=1 Tax=Coptis chinensis TaxID=261450 RepID=A0A835H0N8_9MAGN|nr:hypothetical protein IFM89_034199 [Coptis chinensis]